MRSVPHNIAGRVFMAITAALAWFGLILQLCLMLLNARSTGIGSFEVIVNYLSFFTILSNLLVALVLTSSLLLPHSNFGGFWTSPSVGSGVAVYITIVGVTYALLLRRIWDPQGWQKLADVLLHDLVPLLYVACWLFLMPNKRLRWKQPLKWLIFPAVYFFYSLLRGLVFGRYPYPFIDVVQIGYEHALRNALFLFLAFLGLGLLFVALSRISEQS